MHKSNIILGWGEKMDFHVIKIKIRNKKYSDILDLFQWHLLHLNEGFSSLDYSWTTIPLQVDHKGNGNDDFFFWNSMSLTIYWVLMQIEVLDSTYRF